MLVVIETLSFLENNLKLKRCIHLYENINFTKTQFPSSSVNVHTQNKNKIQVREST